MKIIRLLSLGLRNFKGQKALDINFNNKETDILGDNETGKTTVMDAFLFLLFGKDSEGTKEFGIIPRDTNNKMLEQVDNEVSGVLDEDGSQISLKRTHHQKWVKRRGSADFSYDGNETQFHYNDVPQKASEYKQKIESIIDEELFKLITSPMYFNSLHWEKRRAILTAMAGDISNDLILDKIATVQNKGPLAFLISAMNNNKSVDDFKKEISGKIKPISVRIKEIPIQIKENKLNIPDFVDVSIIQTKSNEKQKELDTADQELIDINKANDKVTEEMGDLRSDLRTLENRREEITREVMKEVNKAKHDEEDAVTAIQREVTTNIERIESYERDIEFIQKGIDADNKGLATYRTQWQDISAETIAFDEGQFACPACKRDFEPGEVEKMKEELIGNFNSSKVARLGGVLTKGDAVKKQIEGAEEKKKEKQQTIDKGNTDMTTLQESLKNRPAVKGKILADELQKNEEFVEKNTKIDELKKKLEAPRTVDDRGLRLIDDKHKIMDEMKILTKQLNINETRETKLLRIDELQKEELKLAQEIADLENVEFTVDKFIKERTNMVEARINNKFKFVTFKMFEQQINGGETPCCDTLIKGVPFSDANNAGRVNAGIDIINALTAYYGVSAPVWIDNRESVVELIPCESQIINLIVEKGLPLTIN